nr:nonstructural protein 1a [Bat astrovirus]
MQDLKPFKIAKEYVDGPIAVVAKSGEFVTFATAEGVKVGNEITYAMTTADGTSGAPVIIPSGRVVGVHVINTGFSGGGVCFTPEDFPPVAPKESERIKALEAEIQRLQKQNCVPQFEQGSVVDDVVRLVREAVKREMKILRVELAGDTSSADESDACFEQKHKGKTKRGKTRSYNATHNRQHGDSTRATRQERKRGVWTEEEYKALQEQGYSVADLKKMAEQIRDQQEADEAAAYEAQWDEGGYPQHEDPGSDYEREINEEWFKQKYVRPPTPRPRVDFKQYWAENYKEPALGITAQHFLEKYDTELDDECKLRLSKKAIALLGRINYIKEQAIQNMKWAPNVDVRIVLQDLNDMWYDINAELYDLGLPTFLQLRKSKNLKRAPANRGQKSTK